MTSHREQPAYVNAMTMEELPQYRHEPQLALAGSDDGSTWYARFHARAAEFQPQGCWVRVGGNREATGVGVPRLPFTGSPRPPRTVVPPVAAGGAASAAQLRQPSSRRQVPRPKSCGCAAARPASPGCPGRASRRAARWRRSRQSLDRFDMPSAFRSRPMIASKPLRR